jgi:hypothetical protein
MKDCLPIQIHVSQRDRRPAAGDRQPSIVIASKHNRSDHLTFHPLNHHTETPTITPHHYLNPQIFTMVSRGLSKAAALLALGLGTSAFVPTKLSSAPSRTVGGMVERWEGCDAVLKRMEGKVSFIIVLDGLLV